MYWMAMKRFWAVSRFVHARVSTRENAKKTRRKIAGAGKVAKRGVFWGSGGAEPVYNRGFPSAGFSFFRNPAPGRFFARIRVRICTFFFFFRFRTLIIVYSVLYIAFWPGLAKLGGTFWLPRALLRTGKRVFLQFCWFSHFLQFPVYRNAFLWKKKPEKMPFFQFATYNKAYNALSTGFSTFFWAFFPFAVFFVFDFFHFCWFGHGKIFFLSFFGDTPFLGYFHRCTL